MAKRITTADLKHSIVLCSAKDVVVDAGTIALVREPAFRCWASVKEFRGPLMSGGFEVTKDRETASHDIVIRYRSDVDVAATAWVYEARGTSQPRWYKVLETFDIDEAGRWHRLRCRLTNRADFVTPPALVDGAKLGAVPLPQGVKL